MESSLAAVSFSVRLEDGAHKSRIKGNLAATEATADEESELRNSKSTEKTSGCRRTASSKKRHESDDCAGVKRTHKLKRKLSDEAPVAAGEVRPNSSLAKKRKKSAQFDENRGNDGKQSAPISFRVPNIAKNDRAGSDEVSVKTAQAKRARSRRAQQDDDDRGEESYTCAHCLRNFQRKSNLRRHMLKLHCAAVSADPDGAAQQWFTGYCCDVCGEGLQYRRTMMAHREVVHGALPEIDWVKYRTALARIKFCADCKKYFRLGSAFDEHACDRGHSVDSGLTELVRSAEQTKPRFACSVCSATFGWKWDYRLHREAEHGDAPSVDWGTVVGAELAHVCERCAKAYPSVEQLAVHECGLRQQPDDESVRQYRCELCQLEYFWKSDYRRHVRTKHPKENYRLTEHDTIVYECPYCAEKFALKKGVLLHMRKAHNVNSESPFVCVKCQKVFRRRDNLERHNRAYHPAVEDADERRSILSAAEIHIDGELAYRCAVCNRNFADANRFVAHYRAHSADARFKCDLCAKLMRTQHQLNTHIKNIHLNIRNYRCDVCAKSFYTKQSCEEHRRIHTGERPFSCEICGKTFVAGNALISHKRFHNDFYPHACHLCPKKFKVRRSLVNHVRTHTGERPFECDLCAKTFNNSSQYSYHKKVTHSEERPFVCAVCGSGFKANKFLTRHMELHSASRNGAPVRKKRKTNCADSSGVVTDRAISAGAVGSIVQSAAVGGDGDRRALQIFVSAPVVAQSPVEVPSIVNVTAVPTTLRKALVCGAALKVYDENILGGPESAFEAQSYDQYGSRSTLICNSDPADYMTTVEYVQVTDTELRPVISSQAYSGTAQQTDSAQDNVVSKSMTWLCVARAGRKRVPLTTKRRLSPSGKEERAKIVKSKKIRLLDCATTAPVSPAVTATRLRSASKEATGASVIVVSPALTRTTGAVDRRPGYGSAGEAKGRGRRTKAKAESAPSPLTRLRKLLPKPEVKVEETAPESAAKAIAPKAAAIKCEECPFATSSRLALERHYDSAHPIAEDEEQPSCHHCAYTCKRKYDIKRHITNVHLARLRTDVEVLTCGICWHDYSSKSALRRHVVRKHFPRNEDEAPPTDAPSRPKSRANRGYCCDICGRGYEMQRQMLAHREVYHATAQPMRWSVFQMSKGKLKRCANCAGSYRAGRCHDEHTCLAAEDSAALEERMAQLLRAQPSFRCDVCSLSFMWKHIFRQHREVMHADSVPLNWDEVPAMEVRHYCASCCVAFDEAAAVEAHQCVEMELESKPMVHTCDVCGAKYQRKSDFRRHQRIRHGLTDDGLESGAAVEPLEGERRKPAINCPYCDTRAMTRSNILAHIKEAHNIDTDSPFVCVVCNKVFKRKATLDRHNQVYHPQGESAIENERILRENQILLNGEQAYHCAICNRNMFNGVRFLAHHRLHFVERKFTCDLCGKQTRTQHQLNTHIKIIHLNIRNYECDICAKSFHSRQSCEEHRRIHTGERPFSCEICGKTFVAMNALFTHKKFHDDFFAHACHLCPKKFKVRRSLTNHIRTHTGERPFQCELCAKTFNNSSRFSYHKKVTHSDNRPHKCTLCGSRFKANKFLLRHMKLHKTRTHVQIRRRNNPEYFAAQEAHNAALAGAGDCAGVGGGCAGVGGSCAGVGGGCAGVGDDCADGEMFQECKPKVEEAVPTLATLLQPQIQYKIIESAVPIGGAVGPIVYCSAAPAISTVTKCYDMVDVSLRFGQTDHSLQDMNDEYGGSSVVTAQGTCYPPSTASN